LFVGIDLELIGEMSHNGICDSPDVFEPEDVAASDDINAAGDRIHTELYDYGTTCHISPYCEMFINCMEIPPKAFNAANKQQFEVVGKGEMIIEILNGVDASQLQLTEVLFSSEVGYTLVSIRWLDECGYTTTFRD
jgi:hypothetical protein